MPVTETEKQQQRVEEFKSAIAAWALAQTHGQVIGDSRNRMTEYVTTERTDHE